MTVLFLLIALFWLSFPLGQFAKYPLSGSLNIALIDIVIGLIALATLIYIAKKKDIPARLFFPWLALVIIMGISLLVSPLKPATSQLLFASLYLLRFVAGSCLIITGYIIARSNYLGNLLTLMIIGGAGVAVSALVQYLIFPYLGPITVSGWDPHLYRAVGSFLDPGFTGIILVFALLSVGLSRKLINLPRNTWSLLMGLFYITLALTYSRASYISFLVGFGIVALRYKAFRWFAKLLVVMFVTILLLPRPSGEGVRLERENSFRARIENWSHTLKIASRYPIFGVGYNTFRFAQEKEGYLKPGEDNHAASGSDSSWLLILATTGITGTTIFSLFIYKIIRQISLHYSELSLITISSLAGLFIHAWFLNSLFYPWVLAWISLLIGMSVGESKVRMKP
jgi:O-antigen ligase